MLVKDLVPVHNRWGKGKEESDTRVMAYLHTAHLFNSQPRGSRFAATAPRSPRSGDCSPAGSLGLLEVHARDRRSGPPGWFRVPSILPAVSAIVLTMKQGRQVRY
jgi:hypothetical protein